MERKLSSDYSTPSDGRINQEAVRKSLKEFSDKPDEGSLFFSMKDADSTNEKFPLMTFNRRESLKLGISPDELRKL